MNLSSKNKPNPNFSMSSMTDLIFILLIFFLVTSSSSSIDFLPVDLPSSESSEQINKEDVNIVVKEKWANAVSISNCLHFNTFSLRELKFRLNKKFPNIRNLSSD